MRAAIDRASAALDEVVSSNDIDIEARLSVFRLRRLCSKVISEHTDGEEIVLTADEQKAFREFYAYRWQMIKEHDAGYFDAPFSRINCALAEFASALAAHGGLSEGRNQIIVPDLDYELTTEEEIDDDDMPLHALIDTDNHRRLVNIPLAATALKKAENDAYRGHLLHTGTPWFDIESPDDGDDSKGVEAEADDKSADGEAEAVDPVLIQEADIKRICRPLTCRAYIEAILEEQKAEQEDDQSLWGCVNAFVRRLRSASVDGRGSEYSAADDTYAVLIEMKAFIDGLSDEHRALLFSAKRNTDERTFETVWQTLSGDEERTADGEGHDSAAYCIQLASHALYDILHDNKNEGNALAGVAMTKEAAEKLKLGMQAAAMATAEEAFEQWVKEPQEPAAPSYSVEYIDACWIEYQALNEVDSDALLGHMQGLDLRELAEYFSVSESARHLGACIIKNWDEERVLARLEAGQFVPMIKQMEFYSKLPTAAKAEMLQHYDFSQPMPIADDAQLAIFTQWVDQLAEVDRFILSEVMRRETNVAPCYAADNNYPLQYMNLVVLIHPDQAAILNALDAETFNIAVGDTDPFDYLIETYDLDLDSYENLLYEITPSLNRALEPSDIIQLLQGILDHPRGFKPPRYPDYVCDILNDTLKQSRINLLCGDERGVINYLKTTDDIKATLQVLPEKYHKQLFSSLNVLHLARFFPDDNKTRGSNAAALNEWIASFDSPARESLLEHLVDQVDHLNESFYSENRPNQSLPFAVLVSDDQKHKLVSKCFEYDYDKESLLCNINKVIQVFGVADVVAACPAEKKTTLFQQMTADFIYDHAMKNFAGGYAKEALVFEIIDQFSDKDKVAYYKAQYPADALTDNNVWLFMPNMIKNAQQTGFLSLNNDQQFAVIQHAIANINARNQSPEVVWDLLMSTQNTAGMLARCISKDPSVLSKLLSRNPKEFSCFIGDSAIDKLLDKAFEHLSSADKVVMAAAMEPVVSRLPAWQDYQIKCISKVAVASVVEIITSATSTGPEACKPVVLTIAKNQDKLLDCIKACAEASPPCHALVFAALKNEASINQAEIVKNVVEDYCKEKKFDQGLVFLQTLMPELLDRRLTVVDCFSYTSALSDGSGDLKGQAQYSAAELLVRHWLENHPRRATGCCPSFTANAHNKNVTRMENLLSVMCDGLDVSFKRSEVRPMNALLQACGEQCRARYDEERAKQPCTRRGRSDDGIEGAASRAGPS